MNIDNDFETIRKSLTGDKKTDVNLLFHAIDEYSGRPYAAELINRIGSLLGEIINGCDVKTAEFLNDYIQKQVRKNYDNKLEEIKTLVDSGKYEEALARSYSLEKELMNSIEKAKSSNPGNTYSFRFYFSPMEYDIGDIYFPGNNILLPIDPVSLYTLRGQALFFLKRDEEAIDSIRKGFDYDPCSVDLCFLLADIEKERYRSISYLSYLEKAKEYMYQENDFFRYLKYLLDYYTNMEKEEKTAKELEFLLKNAKTYKSLVNPSMKDAKLRTRQNNILKHLSLKGIDFHVSDTVLNVAISAYRECSSTGDQEGTNYYKAVLNTFLTPQDKKHLGI